jgi:branched-chain amino acid aminotransferase
MTHLSEISTVFRHECDHHDNDDSRRRRALLDIRFGAEVTDHMVVVGWNEESGWHDPRIRPYSQLEMAPTAGALHYGQVVFEGMKAFRDVAGRPHVFRPADHAARFARSAWRLAMPEMPATLFEASLDALLSVDATWIPSGRNTALYLRPMLVATEEALGFHPSREYVFCLFGTPAAPFFQGQRDTIKVWVCRDFVRAAAGGTGEAKCIGNYAGSLLAHRRAKDAGCDQALWLDAQGRSNVEELGGMNVFFVVDEGRPRLITPALSGTILPGVTRDTVLTVARDLGLVTEERAVPIEEVLARSRSGELTEAFACGTAAVLASIGEICDGDQVVRVGTGHAGPIARRLLDRIVDIQHGYVDDYGYWRRPVRGEAGR